MKTDELNSSAVHPEWQQMLADGRLKCLLCPRFCKLSEGQRGFCFVRQRQGNRIHLTTYGRSSGFCIDPIEKKPLFHFHPGTPVLSFGTAGCNLGCHFCQNWTISKSRDMDRLADKASPVQMVAAAKRWNCRSIAFTYNDPVIFAEYAMDIATLCKEEGIATVAVTAGYIHSLARGEFFKNMDAANVDLKSFDPSFYKQRCHAQLEPVLETLEYIANESTTWLEVTTLLIPGLNDGEKELHAAAEWFATHLGTSVPWHFTAFHPDYKLRQLPPTSIQTLLRARDIALAKGIQFIYTGNRHHPESSTTYCPACQSSVISRHGYEVSNYQLTKNQCSHCHSTIAGHFDARAGNWGNHRQPIRISLD